MGYPGHMDSLLEVGPLLLDAVPALLCQKLGYLLVHPGPAVMNSFGYTPVSFHMHVLDQVLPQGGGGGAKHPVPRKIVSREGGVLNSYQDFTSRGSSLPGKVYEFELLSP